MKILTILFLPLFFLTSCVTTKKNPGYTPPPSVTKIVPDLNDSTVDIVHVDNQTNTAFLWIVFSSLFICCCLSIYKLKNRVKESR